MRAVTILGPSQSGKTTLAESLAALEGRPTTAQIGALTLRTFRYLGEDWASLDIAGGADHLPAAAQALAASDAAVLCVSPDPDAAPLAAPYLRLAEASGVPVFLFINRMDQAHARIRDTVAALQSYAAHAIVLRQVPIREGGQITGAVDLISERAWHYEEGKPSSLVQIPADLRDREQEARTELLEHLADFDDALLEQLIEDKAPPTDRVYALIANLHKHNDIIAAYLGAASHMNGVNRLMKSLRHEAPTPAETLLRLGLGSGVTAIAIAADQKKHVGKSVLLRDFGGRLAQGTSLGGAPIGALQSPARRRPLRPPRPRRPCRGAPLRPPRPRPRLHPGRGLDLPAWTRGTPRPSAASSRPRTTRTTPASPPPSPASPPSTPASPRARTRRQATSPPPSRAPCTCAPPSTASPPTSGSRRRPPPFPPPTARRSEAPSPTSTATRSRPAARASSPRST